MSDVVNLKRFRKQEDRLKKRVKASVNAAKFGRTSQRKNVENDQSLKAEKHLDGHKLQDDDQ